MVERVSHVLPQLQVTVMVLYTGWIFGFMKPPVNWCTVNSPHCTFPLALRERGKG